MSGYSREDFLSGRVCLDEESPLEFREVTMKSREELLMKGQNTPYEKQYIRPDGSRWWGLFSGKRLSENECVEFVLNITESKQAAEAIQESEERFRTMAEASGILIALTDEAGNAIYFNREWLKATGRTMEELLQYGWADFFHEEDAQPFVEAYQIAFLERKELKREFRLANQKGEYRWHLAVISPRYSPSGRFAGFISSCIDITEQKEAEGKLQALSQQLSAANAEVKASNNELASTNTQLLRINADMDNFIYTASHDLKAPINNIEGLMRLLTRRLEKKDELDESLKGIIGMIDGAILRFKETVADLSDIAKVQKQLDALPEAVDLQGVLRDILLDLQSYIEQSQAHIEQRIDSCPSIVFPKKNLKSILYNLISNAIKYRDPSRKPHIIICCQYQDQHQILSVKDNGLGLSTKDENKVFGMFKRQHTHVEGSGVGLYIVKKMIENAGGKITVESQIGEGSTFSVYFKR
jgi:PAS domain S-box-containing protein